MLTILGPVYGFFIVANLGLKTSTFNFDENISNIVEEETNKTEHLNQNQRNREKVKKNLKIRNLLEGN